MKLDKIIQIDVFPEESKVRLMFENGTWKDVPCGDVIIHTVRKPILDQLKSIFQTKQRVDLSNESASSQHL